MVHLNEKSCLRNTQIEGKTVLKYILMKTLLNTLVCVSSFVPLIHPGYAGSIWRTVDKAVMNFHIRYKGHVMKIMV